MGRWGERGGRVVGLGMRREDKPSTQTLWSMWLWPPGVATRYLPCSDVHETMAAVPGHGHPTAAFRSMILLTMTSFIIIIINGFIE